MSIKKYYIYDENGTILSEDGKTRYTLISRKAAYAFLKTADGKRRLFYRYTDKNGDLIAIECAPEIHYERERERKKEERTRQRKEEYEITFVSANDIIDSADEEEIETIETFADETIDIQGDYDRKEDYRTLAEALASLNPEDYELIWYLYRSPIPMSIREYARLKGIPSTTVDYRLKKVLARLRNFF